MNIRQLSRMVWLSGLLVVLTACTESSALPAGPIPTTKASTPTHMATARPEPSPSPFGGAKASAWATSTNVPTQRDPHAQNH